MLKLPITYTNFDGEEVTDTYWFNITKSELIEFEVSYEGGFVNALNKIIESQDKKAIIAEFKKLILWAYGEKSADGKRFVKSEELCRDFSQTAAYDALFIKLSTDDNAAADFINGVVPKDMVEAMRDQDKPQGPPPTPAQTPSLGAPITGVHPGPLPGSTIS
jgi:hypothetical protein